jgi:hypothetical protein
MTKYSVAIIFTSLILVAAPVASAQRLSTSFAGTGSDDPVLVGAADVASCDDRAGARLAPGNHEYNSACASGYTQYFLPRQETQRTRITAMTLELGTILAPSTPV